MYLQCVYIGNEKFRLFFTFFVSVVSIHMNDGIMKQVNKNGNKA